MAATALFLGFVSILFLLLSKTILIYQIFYFLGMIISLPLTPTFSIQPDRLLPDLFADIILQIISVPITFQIYDKLTCFQDKIYYWILVVNRLIAIIDTFLILFLNNAGNSLLIYFSLARSLLRHFTITIALGYITIRRLNLATIVYSKIDKPLLSYLILLGTSAMIILFSGIIFAYFGNGVAMRVAGDAHLAAFPSSTVTELKEVLFRAAAPVSSILWQILQVFLMPLVQCVHAFFDAFFYRTVCGVWTESLAKVNKYNSIISKSWLKFSWPYLVSMTFSAIYIVLTVLSRSVLAEISLGLTIELGHFCTVMNWFVFFHSSLPVLSGDFSPIRDTKSTFSDFHNLSRSNTRFSRTYGHSVEWTPHDLPTFDPNRFDSSFELTHVEDLPMSYMYPPTSEYSETLPYGGYAESYISVDAHGQEFVSRRYEPPLRPRYA